MDVKHTLKPGQRGTKQLVDKFGERLICVRYRYDPQRRKRYKTAEIVVDEQLWIEDRPRMTFGRIEPEPRGPVLVRIAYDEYELRAEVKQRGAKWVPEDRLWRMSYYDVEELGLRPRIVRFEEEVRVRS